MKQFWDKDDAFFTVARQELFTAVIGDSKDKMMLLHQFLPPNIQPLKEICFL